MSGRDLIKAALDTIPSLSAYAHEPANKVAGCAWPVLREFTRDGVLCAPYAAAFDVFVVLPNNHQTTTEDEAEALFPLLLTAIEPLGEWVPPAQVVAIQFDNSSTVPGLRVRVVPDPD